MFDRSSLRKAVIAASLVTELAIVTAVGVFAGGWLDGQLGTEPWLLLLLSLLAFSVGTWRLLTSIQKLQGDDDDSSDHPA